MHPAAVLFIVACGDNNAFVARATGGVAKRRRRHTSLSQQVWCQNESDMIFRG
jgi:hypothetical protein